MKDAECAELKEKSNFRFFRFLFFELWPRLNSKYGQFLMNFHYNSRKKNRDFFVRFSFVSESLTTIWTKKSKRLFLREGGGGLQIINQERALVLSFVFCTSIFRTFFRSLISNIYYFFIWYIILLAYVFSYWHIQLHLLFCYIGKEKFAYDMWASHFSTNLIQLVKTSC